MSVQNRLIIAAILTFVFGLALGRQQRREATQNETMKVRRYALNVAYAAQPFWTDAKSTFEKIGRLTPGVQTEFGGTLDGDPAKQIETLEELISKKVNGIIVFSLDREALGPTINKAIENGIPVVTLFSDVRSKRLAFLGGPERESAKLLAQNIFDNHPQLTKERGKVLISIDLVGNPATDARLQGLKDIIEKYPKLEILPLNIDGGNDAKAAEGIGANLAQHKDIKIIFGLDARSAVGAISALKERNLSKGTIVVTGWDSDEDVLRGIKEDWIHSTSVLNTSLMTQLSFALLESKTLGYLYPETLRLRELNLPAVPDKIEIAETLITKKNVEAYFRKSSP